MYTMNQLINVFFVLLIVSALSCLAENASPTFKYVTAYAPEGKYLQKTDIEKNSVNVLQPVIFIINENNTDKQELSLSKDIIDEYLERQISNVFIVDWNTDAKAEKKELLNAVESAGLALADFIATIFNKTGEQYLNIHLVGIFLGSEVAGSAGKRVLELTGRKVNRITGLDPTYYLINYEGDALNGKLRGKNANFVDVIHSKFNKTDVEQLGDVDFYIYDEVCINDSTKCDKSRSAQLFAQSINSDKIKAVKCASLIYFISGNCTNGDKITFGENVPQDVKEKYFLKTSTNLIGNIVRRLGK